MENTKKSSVSWLPLILVSMASFVCALDQTFMNVSMSQVVQDLDTDVSTIQTIMSLYTLITASMMLVSAKLQDIYGKRAIFVVGSLFYGVGTTIAAISPNVYVLFVGWALFEGIGAAMMTPGIISIVSGTYSGTQRTTALSISSAVTVVSAGIGPLFGGFVTSYVSWRFGFAFEVIFIILIVCLFKKIPYFPSIADKKELDITGAIVSIIGLLMLVIGILQLDDEKYALSACIIGVSILVLAGFVLWEKRRKKKDKTPLFDVSLLKHRNLAIGTLIILVCCLVMAGIIFSVSVYLQSVRQLSAIKTGVMLLPLTLGMMFVSFVASKSAVKLGHKNSIIIGFVLAIIGCIVLNRQFTADASFWALAPGMFILGIGLEFPLSLASDTALQGIPAEAQSSCSGLFSTGQSLGMSMGTAIIGVVMHMGANAGLYDAIQKIVKPAGLSEDEIMTVAKEYYEKLGNIDASSLPGNAEMYKTINELIIQDGMGIVMIVSAALLVIAAIMAFALKGKKKNEKESNS